MNLARGPCFGCSDRRLGCHSSCAAYADYRRIRDAMLEQAHAENAARGYVADAIRTMKARRRRR